MDKCTCKITPGTSAYGGNQIDSRGCEKHDTRDEIIEQLRQERDNALRYTELLIAERDAARAEVERLREDAARARWCEEMKATVSYNGITQKWTVIADEPMPWRRRYFDSLDRNAAIDAAMKGGK